MGEGRQVSRQETSKETRSEGAGAIPRETPESSINTSYELVGMITPVLSFLVDNTSTDEFDLEVEDWVGNSARAGLRPTTTRSCSSSMSRLSASSGSPKR